MQLLESIVVRFSRGLDFLAGIILAATALLVAANILGRVLFNSSILGTYEMVGYLTAAVVGLALARCALERGHIAVAFLVDKLPVRLQRTVDLATGLPVFVFLCFTTYSLIVYASGIVRSGEVMATTQFIFYPFLYLVALGFLALALTVLLDLLQKLSGGERR